LHGEEIGDMGDPAGHVTFHRIDPMGSFRAKLVCKPTKDCMHPADRGYETEDGPYCYVLMTEVDGQERFVETRDQPDQKPRISFYSQSRDLYDDVEESYFPDWPVPDGGGPRSGIIVRSMNDIELFAPRYRIADADPWKDKQPSIAGFYEAMVDETGDILESFGADRTPTIVK
jgi:hypothetical protein